MIVLDTSAIIELLKETVKGEKVFKLIGGEDSAITSFSVYELLKNVKESELPKLETFFTKIPVLGFDLAAGFESAHLEKSLSSGGKIIEKVDIFIASICLANNAKLITLDRHFERIGGLNVVIV